MHETTFQIFVNALLANNFVLAMFLGLCPFLGVSGKLDTAFPMGVATTFVMLVASLCAYGLNLLLTAFHLEFLRLISYIVIIASSVQLVEMVLKKYSPALFRALGIYLPLITTNCAVLGVALFQTAREYDFIQSMTFSFGGGAGFTLALVLMACGARAPATVRRARPGAGHRPVPDAGRHPVAVLHGLRRAGGLSDEALRRHHRSGVCDSGRRHRGGPHLRALRPAQPATRPLPQERRWLRLLRGESRL